MLSRLPTCFEQQGELVRCVYLDKGLPVPFLNYLLTIKVCLLMSLHAVGTLQHVLSSPHAYLESSPRHIQSLTHFKPVIWGRSIAYKGLS